MKTKYWSGMLVALVALALNTGCADKYGTYHKNWHNDLANGQVADAYAGSSGTTAPADVPINGHEEYDGGWNYHLNPFYWLFSDSVPHREVVVSQRRIVVNTDRPPAGMHYEWFGGRRFDVPDGCYGVMRPNGRVESVPK